MTNYEATLIALDDTLDWDEDFCVMCGEYMTAYIDTYYTEDGFCSEDCFYEFSKICREKFSTV